MSDRISHEYIIVDKDDKIKHREYVHAEQYAGRVFMERNRERINPGDKVYARAISLER